MVLRSLLSIPLFVLTACGLTACGGIGFAPMVEDDGSLDASLDESEQTVQADDGLVNVEMAGRTYSTHLAELAVLEPSGLQPLLEQAAEEELLFHVVDEGDDRLDIVMTVAGRDGAQDVCQPVYSLPQADWTNPDFYIEDGETEIAVAGQPLVLDQLDLEAKVTADGQVWEEAVLTSIIDTRDLLGGSLPEGTNVCHLVEELGGACLACSDGEEACATLQLGLEAALVDIDFDPDARPDGGC